MMYFLRTFVLKCTNIFLISIFSLSIANAENNDATWQLLQKTAVAGHVLNYNGIFVYSNRNETKAVQVKHIYNGQGEYARNVTLDLSPREMFSQGSDLVIYNPKEEKVIIEKRHAQNLFPNVLPLKSNRLKNSYYLHEAEEDTVSGRASRQLLLFPKDNYRYSYKFWVDKEYGLLLKYEMLNDKHEVLESIVFNELNLIKNLELDWFQPHIDNKKNYEMEEEMPIVPDSSNSPAWSINQLPAGYLKIDQMKVTAHNRKVPMTQLIFSDGLSSISLFIEPLSGQIPPRIGNVKMGYTNLYANVKKGYQITVVGEVPQEAVVKIGESVSFK
jgi:sigma-E factor negative regulatory protein RseB